MTTTDPVMSNAARPCTDLAAANMTPLWTRSEGIVPQVPPPGVGECHDSCRTEGS